MYKRLYNDYIKGLRTVFFHKYLELFILIFVVTAAGVIGILSTARTACGDRSIGILDFTTGIGSFGTGYCYGGHVIIEVFLGFVEGVFRCKAAVIDTVPVYIEGIARVSTIFRPITAVASGVVSVPALSDDFLVLPFRVFVLASVALKSLFGPFKRLFKVPLRRAPEEFLVVECHSRSVFKQV